jgi:hypothetical protein
MLNQAARRHGSCCGAPPGPDCDDRTRPKREQRHVENQQWRRYEEAAEVSGGGKLPAGGKNAVRGNKR